MIGHGRRKRQAHDRLHDSIQVRRGICKRCRHTLTVLPGGCIPGTQYSLPARQEAITQLALGRSLEQAAPECRDADRVADAATIRRWAQRRWESVCVWVQWAWRWWRGPPTLLAWDWRAAARMLIPEPNPA